MTRPTHLPRGQAFATRALLESCAGIVAGRTRGAPPTRADVQALRQAIRLLERSVASGAPAAWALRLEHESVRRPPITPRLS